jgi:integrase
MALGLDSVGIAAWLAYLTSKAQRQILTLRKDAVSLYGIQFGSRKGGADTFVEWTSELADAVRTAFARSNHSQYLIPTGHGSAYSSGGFRALWHRRMAEWVSRGHEHFTFHDLRAKTVTDLSSQGRKASELTGHRDEKTVARVYDRRRVRKAPAAR